MPIASLALLLLPLLQCLHFPVSGPYPQSPFSLLTPLPSLFPISLLTSLPSLLPHPVIPASPAGTQHQQPLSLHRPFMVSLSNHIPAASLPQPAPDTIRGTRSGAETRWHPTIPPLPALMVSPSNHTPFTQASRARHPSESVATPLPRPLHPPERQFKQVHIAPQTRQKSAPRRLKSFLEKTLTARETPNSPPPKTARSQTPHHSGSASSSLALWERVGACPGRDPGVRVFRSKRCPAAPAGASTPIRRRPTVPNPAHLAATTGDNRMADPLPRRTR